MTPTPKVPNMDAPGGETDYAFIQIGLKGQTDFPLSFLLSLCNPPPLSYLTFGAGYWVDFGWAGQHGYKANQERCQGQPVDLPPDSPSGQ